MKIAFAAAVLASASLAHADIAFKTSCKALLTSGSDTLTVTAESEPFFAPYGKWTKIELGPYTLYANLGLNQPFGSDSMEPTFEMSLYKGNPIQGRINEARAQGLEIETRVPGKPFTLYGLNFLNFQYAGKTVSRVDYNCSLTRQ